MLDDTTVMSTPSPQIRVGRLDSIRAVRRELAKVYRDMRGKKISTMDGSRLAFVLATIGRILERSDLEQRLEALEQGRVKASQESQR